MQKKFFLFKLQNIFFKCYFLNIYEENMILQTSEALLTTVSHTIKTKMFSFNQLCFLLMLLSVPVFVSIIQWDKEINKFILKSRLSQMLQV